MTRIGLKTFLFTLVGPCTVTVVVPYCLLSFHAELYGSIATVGFLPIALGGAFYLWCAWDFVTVGQGTPAPIDPPRFLVARGLYRVVRNPMYVGILLVLLGESIIFRSVSILIYAAIVCLLFHLFVVFYEEPTLKRKFGASYEEYCRAVPRWIPRRPLSGRS